MGRKKSNARSLPHGKKIHVNKYISKRGNTKKKVTAFEVPNSNVYPTFEELPAHRWPTARTPKQHEIWFAELGDHYGTSVQSGNRPVLVITNDVSNRYSQTLTVIPMTSKMKKLELPTHVILTKDHCEMLRAEQMEDSVLLVEQITTIDRSALYNRLCRVTSAEKKQEIERAVARQFDMKHSSAEKHVSAENTEHHHDGKEV